MNVKVSQKRCKGFSLIELLVVLTILGLLASVVGPRVISALGGGKVKVAQVQISDLGTSLEQYYLHVGHYPSTDEGLEALLESPAGTKNWQGPYLQKRKVPLDPWNNAYQYRFPSENGVSFDIFSLGADGAEGGEGDKADVVSWE